ncbi:Hypothetical protein I5071_49180 [Sandaracinus amylolyticus]|nr:Hypothetical protein I5071_49180 [Sandaracinus amylolyticus]
MVMARTMRRPSAERWRWWLAGIVAASLVGCGDDDGGSPDASTSFDAGPGDAGSDSGFACPNAMPPPIAPDLLPPCLLEGCIDAHCVPNSFVSEEQATLLANCDEGSKCVPDPFIETTGEFLLATCRSVGGAEGRCVSRCIPQISEQADMLPEEGCQEGEECAPCYDPRTGESTGVCNLGCDPGPQEPPDMFMECCGGAGSCVPTDLVPEAQREQLGVDTCTEENTLCAPSALIDPTSQPDRCDSIAGVEGRCLPACLPAIGAQADRLSQGSCDAGELCAPCYDPTNGEDTGACRLNGDEPEDPATTFDRCCGGIGACVPSTLVPEAQRSQLGTDTCEDEGTLCAPDALIAGAEPTSCRSLGDAEGRCLPSCLPSIAEQADRLPQSTCTEAHLCAPCYDPISGEDTGACRLNGDMPDEPANTFDRCCGGIGACVPSTLVPEAQRAQLGTDTCTDAGALCAPDSLIAGTEPTTCRSIDDSEGRCLPACLPAIGAQADRLSQGTCDAGHLCAPCFDPISGDDTGACRLNGDMPDEPAYTFPNCCGGLGSCVPPELVSPAQRTQLDSTGCTAPRLCAPDDFTDPTFRPMTCDSIAGAEGRCLPSCLPAVSSQGDRLPQSTCPATHRCAPCFDPITGAESGACRVNGDMPSEPAFTFPNCCVHDTVGARGRCVPPELTTMEQQDALEVASRACAARDGVQQICVPNPFLANPSHEFAQCTPPLSAENSGVCVPDCLVESWQLPLLQQRTCQTGERCAPCALAGNPPGCN